jgi:hypothetical protein
LSTDSGPRGPQIARFEDYVYAVIGLADAHDELRAVRELPAANGHMQLDEDAMDDQRRTARV